MSFCIIYWGSELRRNQGNEKVKGREEAQQGCRLSKHRGGFSSLISVRVFGSVRYVSDFQPGGKDLRQSYSHTCQSLVKVQGDTWASRHSVSLVIERENWEHKHVHKVKTNLKILDVGGALLQQPPEVQMWLRLKLPKRNNVIGLRSYPHV